MEKKKEALINDSKLYQIAFNVVQHMSNEAASSKHEESRALLMNLQYTLKHIYERNERVIRDIAALDRLKQGTPLHSTVVGWTANQAIDHLQNILR